LVNTPEVKDGEPDLSLSGLTEAYMSGKEIIITEEFYERFKENLDGLGFGVGQKIKKGGSN
jgi:hypothetical protein